MQQTYVLFICLIRCGHLGRFIGGVQDQQSGSHFQVVYQSLRAGWADVASNEQIVTWRHFLLPTCWDVYNFGLVSEKQTHFGVMYLTHKIFVNRIKPRWIWLTLFFWTWRILGCTTSARRILKAVGFYIEFFQWDGVSHGRLNGTIGCGTALLLFFFRFLKSQRPITENCQGLWNLPKAVILSIYIYAICLEAPHLLQSGIAG